MRSATFVRFVMQVWFLINQRSESGGKAPAQVTGRGTVNESRADVQIGSC